MVNTLGTGKIPECQVQKILKDSFNLTPRGIIDYLDLRRPIYKMTAAYGHFGRTEPEFSWERTDSADELRKAAAL
jgi:S-adenosylmethionine synthetase